MQVLCENLSFLWMERLGSRAHVFWLPPLVSACSALCCSVESFVWVRCWVHCWGMVSNVDMDCGWDVVGIASYTLILCTAYVHSIKNHTDNACFHMCLQPPVQSTLPQNHLQIRCQCLQPLPNAVMCVSQIPRFLTAVPQPGNEHWDISDILPLFHFWPLLKTVQSESGARLVASSFSGSQMTVSDSVSLVKPWLEREILGQAFCGVPIGFIRCHLMVRSRFCIFGRNITEEPEYVSFKD